MRLFIAVHFSKEVKETLLSAIDELKAQVVTGNFTKPENLHLTLAFIGESDRVLDIREIIDRCTVPPFEMAVCGAGHFGNLYWVGIEKSPKLKALAESIQNELRISGFDIEDREFKPHITVARQVEASEPVKLNVERKAMNVTSISLMKSARINGKLVYTEVYGRRL